MFPRPRGQEEAELGLKRQQFNVTVCASHRQARLHLQEISLTTRKQV